MKLEADRVSVSGAHAPLLLPTSPAAQAGQVTLVAGDLGHGQVALALALAGRLMPGPVHCPAPEDRVGGL